MPDDLSLLMDAAAAAGVIACRHFKASPEVWDKPGGAGPVTEADIAVDTMLREELLASRPDYGWLSEETEDNSTRLDREKVFIVDPIDGTRAFIDGSPTWAHSLAVSELGQITAAIVYLPEHDKMYSAGRDLGAFLNGAPLKASPINMVEGATLLAAKPTFDAWNWQDGQVPPVTRKFRSSLAYRMSLVGEGRFDAMATLRATWEWDVAAGTLIVEEAGGRVTDRRQNPLMFNNKGAQVNGVVAGGKIIQTALATRLSQA